MLEQTHSFLIYTDLKSKGGLLSKQIVPIYCDVTRSLITGTNTFKSGWLFNARTVPLGRFRQQLESYKTELKCQNSMPRGLSSTRSKQIKHQPGRSGPRIQIQSEHEWLVYIEKKREKWPFLTFIAPLTTEIWIIIIFLVVLSSTVPLMVIWNRNVQTTRKQT